MFKTALVICLIWPFFAFSQEKLSFQRVDSLTYQYYLKGDWQKIIDISRTAFKQHIDSKFIRQRAGYAFFKSGDYSSARIQYEKAWSFDQADMISCEYLYYANLLSGSANTRFYAGFLNAESAGRLGVMKFIPVESIDTEFSLKTNQTTTRSNQLYSKTGINTELGYRLSLYQAYAFFTQKISSVLTRQPEYLAILKYSLSPFWQIRAAYHGLFTNVGGVNYPGNLGLIALNSQVNRFSFEANASILKFSSATTRQAGFMAGITLPGKSNFYLSSAVICMNELSSYRAIFAQSAGLKFTPNCWAEASLTRGNLKNYNTYNSMYIYNSADPSVFRTGFTLFYFIGKHLSVNGNFTFDQQKIENTTNTSSNQYYYQYSYSGGLKWKL